VIDAVFRDGYHPGGIILPGIDPSLDILAHRTARLKRYPVRKPARIIGRTTAECVQNGVIRGTAMAVQGYIMRLKKFFRRNFLCLATGGWAHLMAPLIPEIDRVVPELSLWGIYHIYRRNA
jgi:type III pantothenate kinase